MTGRTVVCTTTSEPEAALVAGLLEAEGFAPIIERSPLRSVFPVPIAFLPLLKSSLAGSGPSACGTMKMLARSLASNGYGPAVCSRIVCGSTISVPVTALV